MTDSLGFEGGAVFSQNGQYIAFYAYRPTKTSEIERFAHMKQYGFTDISNTQLYIYNLKTGIETNVTKILLFLNALFLRYWIHVVDVIHLHFCQITKSLFLSMN